MQQDFDTNARLLLEERVKSVSWLKSLKNPSWNNDYLHPKLGPFSAEYFLADWLAHYYLHIRQAQKVVYLYLGKSTGIDVSYAGKL